MRKTILKTLLTTAFLSLCLCACGTDEFPPEAFNTVSTDYSVSDDSISENIVEPTRAALEGMDPASFQFDGGKCAEILYNQYDFNLEDAVAVAQGVYSQIQGDVKSLDNVIVEDNTVTLDCIDARGELWESIVVEK